MGDVILVLNAVPWHDVSEDVVPPVACDASWRRGITWHSVGARITIVSMEVVSCNVGILV